MELLVGARTCPALATEVRVAIGRQLDLDRLVATLATGVQLLRAGAG